MAKRRLGCFRAACRDRLHEPRHKDRRSDRRVSYGCNDNGPLLSPPLSSARVVNLIDARRQLHKRRRGHRDFALAGQRQRVREILLGVEQLNALTRLELLAVQDLVR